MIYRQKNMTLADVCDIQSGYTARTSLIKDEVLGVPAIQLRDLRDDEVFLESVEKYRLEGKLDRYAVRPGDILFRSRGEKNTASIAVGKLREMVVALLPVMVIRPKSDAVLPEYIAWSINQPEAQRHLDSRARGTKLRMIPRGGLEKIPINIPPLNIQHMVVEVDRLSAREERLLRELADKKREFTRCTLLRQVQNAQLHGNEAGHKVAR